MAKTLIRLDKVQAYEVGNIVNVIHSAELENGRFINLGTENTSVARAYDVAVPVTATLGTEEVLLHASAEAQYDPTKSIDDFALAIGSVGRAFHLTIGDEFTMTQDAVDGVIAEGKFLIPQNGSVKLVVADDLTGGTRLGLKIIDKDVTLGVGRTAITVRVVKA